ncbi:hypothetical protein J2X55_002279 [Microbacterium sp. 1154]|uniref:hypothetical protein n=1 Tax=Microbacterium sp. 1154 TaxID=2817733 RepID=UPI0028575051|nr:hypothetical protein [Microbacterium sp. 1154]MDR6691367.1 hypothetical protein [Microbacterium sp. 1154]
MTERRTISVETARAAVLASGELEMLDGPYFLAEEDGAWRRFHFGGTPPIAARVVITRRGHSPREVIIGWDEYEAQDQTDPDWNATRALKPMTIFGSEVERHAYRVTFADILAPLLAAAPAAPDDGPAPWETAARPTRDWFAEFALARSIEEIDALHVEARAAQAYSVKDSARLDMARRNRRRQIEDPSRAFEGAAAAVVAEMDEIRRADDADVWAPGPSENPQGPAAAERLAELNEMVARPRPQDHLPSNRAGRRAQKRKGSRRGR